MQFVIVSSDFWCSPILFYAILIRRRAYFTLSLLLLPFGVMFMANS